MASPPLAFFRRITERKIVQWLVVYLTGCFALLQVLGELAETVLLLQSMRGSLVLLMALGIPVVLVLAWYHGEKGRQRISGPELLILATLLAVLGGVFALLNRGPQEEAPDSASAPEFEPAPAIAVLPSIGAGAGAGEIGEGIVSVLSSGLDAVPGWRAVNTRTVLARWKERVGEGATADEATSLDVARATGAVYAVLPTTTVLGSTVRVSAEVYDLRDPQGTRRSIERSGSPDDLLPLADGLAVEILGVVLQGEGQIPEVDLSRTTSESPEALRAFLQGEVAYREYRLEDARDAYDLALEHDPSFARAHYRLVEVHSWGATLSPALQGRHGELAFQNIDRLTEREALVVRGLSASDVREKIALLREAATRYPDDPTAWYQLGERLLHEPGSLASLEEIDAAFTRALELDPGRTVLYPHPISLAFRELGDSARATTLVEAFLEAASGVTGPVTVDVDPRGGRLALALAFGDESAREAARTQAYAELGQRDATTSILSYLFHPRHYDALRKAMVDLGELQVSMARVFAGDVLWRGRVREALSLVGDSALAAADFRALHEAALMGAGAAVPRDLLLLRYGPASIGPEALVVQVFRAGMWAADEGRWVDHRRAVEVIRSGVEAGVANTPESLEGLEAYGALRRGEARIALPALEELVTSGELDGERIVLWALGEAYEATGQLGEAARVFGTAAWPGLGRTYRDEPLVRRRLAQVLEAHGRGEEAAGAFAYFVEHWADADPELQPMVQEAREAIERLRADR